MLQLNHYLLNYSTKSQSTLNGEAVNSRHASEAASHSAVKLRLPYNPS